MVFSEILTKTNHQAQHRIKGLNLQKIKRQVLNLFKFLIMETIGLIFLKLCINLKIYLLEVKT